MKTRILATLLICWSLAAPAAAGEPRQISAEHLVGHGLRSGPARELLPGSGALVHLQVRDLFSVLEGIEEIVVAGVPEQALPPELRDVLRSPHPILNVLGAEHLGEPLTSESFERLTGLDPRGSLTLSLYFGDPRQMFILSLPARSKNPLVHVLNELLQPEDVEVVTLGAKAALRVVSPRVKFAPELFLVSSDDALYICGDRSLAIALHSAPASQRFGQDGFLSRAVPAIDDQQIRLVINPAPIQPFALQLQGIFGFAKMMIPDQRQRLLAGVPAEVREAIEIQLRSQLGLRDLEEFAAYAEAVVVATLEQAMDALTGRLVAFEGLSIGAQLRNGASQFNVKVHAQGFQEESGIGPIPMDEVRRALAWLGPDHQSFSVVGREPAPTDLPTLTSWVRRVQREFEIRGLPSAGLDKLAQLLADRAPLPALENRVPWTLTAYAPLRPQPSLTQAASLRDYFLFLDLPVHRPVKVVPGDKSILETSFRSEVDILNRNRALTFEFVDSFQKQRPWVDQLNRFQAEHLDRGVSRYVRESAWITRGGWFGYDQHELINRQVVWALQTKDYVVFHSGARESDWLLEFAPAAAPGLAPGVARFLDRVPEGVNRVSVSRVLTRLPAFIEWLGALESRTHADVQGYLDAAQALVSASASLEQAQREIRGLKMPELIGSVHLDPATRQVYALLPTGDAPLLLPRPRLVPVMQELLEDYAARADEVGGSLSYTRSGDGAWEFTTVQRWDAVTTLTRTVGNALVAAYLSTPDGQQELLRKVSTARDGDPTVFDELIAQNPQWAFIPRPRPKTEARPTQAIPTRAATAGPGLVDLTPHYNAALTETWHAGGLANNTLKDLPTGLQEFGGVTFDARGIVQLTGQEAARVLRVKFPKEVTGIQVGCKGAKVHFLHACGWPSPRGAQVAEYVIRYVNGQTQSIPVNYGKDVQDWWMNDPWTGDNGPEVVWRGRNHAAPSDPDLGLFKSTWNNPFPEVEIAAIDFRSASGPSAPFLIAITVE